MRLFYRNNVIGHAFENDTVGIIKHRVFAENKSFYPDFVKLFFISNDKKNYMKFKNETVLDHSFEGDIHIEFLGDDVGSEMLSMFISFPKQITAELEKSWGIDDKEISFVLNKKFGTRDPNEIDVNNKINNAHKESVKFMNEYNKQLKNIPQPMDYIKTKKIEYVKHELFLKDSDEFKRFINIRFTSGASGEIPLIIKNVSKGNPMVKTIDVDLKNKISKKDLKVEYDSFVFLTKGSDDRYIFGLNSGKLYVNTTDVKLKVFKDIAQFITDEKIIDIRYTIEFNTLINIKKLPSLITNYYSTFFKEKESVRKGNTILLEYTRTIQEDIKINIKNSKDGVSTPVVIYNMNSNFHIHYILSILQSLIYKSITTKVTKSFFNLNDDTEDDIVKKKQANIKKLKSQGATVNSVKCQGARQPSLDNDRSKTPKKYELVHSGDRYICNNNPYLFPGFTTDENVCCFKKDQRKKESYNRLTGNSLIKLKVKASNFVVNNKRIIKMSDGGNSYFYIKTYNPVKIEAINDKSEIEQIKSAEKKGNIWLKESLLKNVLYTNTKDCKNSPKLNSSGEYVCKKVGDDQYKFGYTESSVPCCFKENRPVLVTRILEDNKPPSEFYDSSYIITTDKSIDKNRLGLVPQEVYYMLTKQNLNTKSPEKNSYYRFGTKSGLISVIKGIYTGFNVDDIATKEIFELSRSEEFKSLKDLKDYLVSGGINYIRILDFISLYLKTNIILIDFETDDIDKCISIYSKNPKSIVFIKNEGYYELLVSISKKDGKYTKVFKSQDDIIKNLKSYLKFKCDPLTISLKLTLGKLYKSLKADGVKVVSQVVSKLSSKVIFVETYDHVFLPVYPTKGIKSGLKIKIIDGIDPRISKKIFDIFMKKYKKYYSDLEFIQNGLLLNKYLILPTKGTFSTVDVSNLSYINGMFKGNKEDKRVRLMEKIDKQDEYYYSLRYNFSKLVTAKIKDDISSVVNSTDNRKHKFIKVKGIAREISGYSGDDLKYITQRLLGLYRAEILNKELSPKKIRMIKLDFKNYTNLYNWLKL